jgi:cytochrome bd-type quinol oxidase subunit 2
LYLALLIVLVALMARGVSFEYQRKVDDPRWRATWRWSLAAGSALVPLLIGVAFGDLLHGLPINSSHEYTGNFFNLLVPYGIWTGITFLVLSALMGATYLSLKTTGELHERARQAAAGIGAVAVAVVFGFMTWTHVGLSTGFVPKPLEAVAMLAVIGAAVAASAKADGWAFLAAALGMAATVWSIFTELYPRVMISSTKAANSLTIANTASPSYTLKVMTVVAAIFFPVVLVYQAWSYHVFRKRLAAPRVDSSGETGSAAAEGPARTAEPS